MTSSSHRSPLGPLEDVAQRPAAGRTGETSDCGELQQASERAGAQAMAGLKPRPPHLRALPGRRAAAATEHAPVGAEREPTVEPVDPRDLDALYRRFAPYVAAVAMRILGRDDELEDLVHDAFLNALRGLADLREPAAIKGWLARITVRLAIRRLRQRRLRRLLHLERDLFEYDALAAPAASPEQRALIGKLYRVLDALPAADRVVWVLRHVQGEQLQHIPELCGCSLSTAQRRLRRAESAVERGLSDG
jgi:RNA polymerase sigma-70 factor (ECF subfamily)